MSEHDEQVALFQRIKLLANKYPELHLLFAIPNGGHRHLAVAKKLKAEGVKAGVPDLCLPVPKGQFHGLWIEMKVKPNRTTQSQRKWLTALHEQGYKTKVCYGQDEAWDCIMEYLDIISEKEKSERY